MSRFSANRANPGNLRARRGSLLDCYARMRRRADGRGGKVRDGWAGGRAAVSSVDDGFGAAPDPFFSFKWATFSFCCCDGGGKEGRGAKRMEELEGEKKRCLSLIPACMLSVKFPPRPSLLSDGIKGVFLLSMLFFLLF